MGLQMSLVFSEYSAISWDIVRKIGPSVQWPSTTELQEASDV